MGPPPEGQRSLAIRKALVWAFAAVMGRVGRGGERRPAACGSGQRVGLALPLAILHSARYSQLTILRRQILQSCAPAAMACESVKCKHIVLFSWHCLEIAGPQTPEVSQRRYHLT